MGVKISIDKHVSELDDILEMSPHYLSRVQFDSKISPDITQHLKVSYVLNCIYCHTILPLFEIIFASCFIIVFLNICFWNFHVLILIFQNFDRSGDSTNQKGITIKWSRRLFPCIIWQTISFSFRLRKRIFCSWYTRPTPKHQTAWPTFHTHFGASSTQ